MSNEVDFDFILADDFLFFLDLCRDPNQVFEPDSSESCVAQHWLDKLCRYECDDLSDRRLRNIYMSYLCVCLIDGVLRGPFMQMPKTGKLQPMPQGDFSAERKQQMPCAPVKTPRARFSKECDEAAKKASTRTPEQDCEEKLFLDCNRGAAIADPAVRGTMPMEKAKSAHMLNNGYMLKSGAMLQDKCARFDGGNEEFTDDYTDGEKSAGLQDNETLRDDVESLLEAISAELRGEISAGCNEYLESELARYKNFIINFSNIACILEQLHSKPAIRSFLLLNLQNDLVKLISDNNNKNGGILKSRCRTFD